MRSASEHGARHDDENNEDGDGGDGGYGGGGGGHDDGTPPATMPSHAAMAPQQQQPAAPLPQQPTSMASALQQQQQQKTRRRRGSLRKVALLGRGAQRERRDSKSSAGLDRRPPMGLDTAAAAASVAADGDLYGLGISDITPRPSMDGYANRPTQVQAITTASPVFMSPLTQQQYHQHHHQHHHHQQPPEGEPGVTSPTISYSTTDDEDILQLPVTGSFGSRPAPPSLSSGSDSYFATRAGLSALQQQRRSVNRARSPLALAGGLASTPGLSGVAGVAVGDAEWDYAETERWGWVVLLVTWVVFVVGMGSCLGVWSWAWDVGTTPYAPPELEDDPTLPIVGYYPALIILTGVMAWVWVVVAWVGMKYFRHAKISGE